MLAFGSLPHRRTLLRLVFVNDDLDPIPDELNNGVTTVSASDSGTRDALEDRFDLINGRTACSKAVVMQASYRRAPLELENEPGHTSPSKIRIPGTKSTSSDASDVGKSTAKNLS